MMHVEVLRNGAATAPCGEVATCPESLVLREFRLATERDALLARGGASVGSAFDDALALVFREGGEESQEALADFRREIEVRLVEHLDRRPARMRALHDADAVKHGSRCAIPFGENKNVALAERV